MIKKTFLEQLFSASSVLFILQQDTADNNFVFKVRPFFIETGLEYEIYRTCLIVYHRCDICRM